MDKELNQWSVLRVDRDTYVKQTGMLRNSFNRPEFSETNRDKVDDIWYLLLKKGGSVRFATTFGRKGNRICCPFSAPFAYPEEIKANIGVDNYEGAGKALDDFIGTSGIEKASIVFPPSFYDQKAIETWMNIFFYLGWRVDTVDINFGFRLPKVAQNYEEIIAHNARKNLRIAKEAGLLFSKCETKVEKREAYRVIQVNRSLKGYPLKMSEEQVLQTMDVVPSDMFLLSMKKESIAAALVYDVTPVAAQVVYWGDIPGHPEKKAINYLAYKLIQIYFNRGYEYLDIGPSTENGVPNYGLCDFKDSIGCERTAKYRLSKMYR